MAIFNTPYQAQAALGIPIWRGKASSRRSCHLRDLIATPCFAGDERAKELARVLQMVGTEAVGKEPADAVAFDLAAVAAGAEDFHVGA